MVYYHVWRQAIEEERVLRGRMWGDDIDWMDEDDWDDWDDWDRENGHRLGLIVGLINPGCSDNIPSARKGMVYTVNPLRDYFHFFGRRGARVGVADVVTLNPKRAF
ncbi:hypothetical protein GLAREA_03537 [Glarea lozoyensis ATCC 20868]|uniref:Uncharacterized protein n=1 Tax=Glarea lozoyensis (strain ATCC 20868 / MF5171) TaxID=1116229 RepID=S3CY81_GLAL2|nr:uncharacterized protein GLAREA_03537 [Glarea lozoyensis ATCC 20868]EPE30570.1 hypothetical protein GLAREA_03537 [Glarea lozoyensis ATCC 20868]